jgi:hypothetical protein
MVEAKKTGLEQLIQVFDDDAWRMSLDALLYVNCNQAIEILNCYPNVFALEDDQDFSLEEVPRVVRCHIL